MNRSLLKREIKEAPVHVKHGIGPIRDYGNEWISRQIEPAAGSNLNRANAPLGGKKTFLTLLWIKKTHIPVALEFSMGCLTGDGDISVSRGVIDLAGIGVGIRSADSRLELPVITGVTDSGDALLLVSANAWFWNWFLKKIQFTQNNNQKFWYVENCKR